MSYRLGGLLVVTGAVLAALRCWPLHGGPLHGCADCVVPV